MKLTIRRQEGELLLIGSAIGSEASSHCFFVSTIATGATPQASCAHHDSHKCRRIYCSKQRRDLKVCVQGTTLVAVGLKAQVTNPKTLVRRILLRVRVLRESASDRLVARACQDVMVSRTAVIDTKNVRDQVALIDATFTQLGAGSARISLHSTADTTSRNLATTYSVDTSHSQAA